MPRIIRHAAFGRTKLLDGGFSPPIYATEADVDIPASAPGVIGCGRTIKTKIRKRPKARNRLERQTQRAERRLLPILSRRCRHGRPRLGRIVRGYM
jgi:hypothetical protein